MRIIDLFAGCGGLSKGFEMAGFEINGFVFNDEISPLNVTFQILSY